MFDNISFSNETVRAYTSVFASLLNNVRIQKKGDTQLLRVPLHIGTQQKWYKKIKNDISNDTKDHSVIPKGSQFVPSICIEIKDLQYNQEKARQKSNILKIESDDPTRGIVLVDYMEVPYNLIYDVHIVSESMTDMLAIVEQILPQFKPNYTLRMKEPPHDTIRDVVITCSDPSIGDMYTEDLTNVQLYQWTIQFNIPIWLYRRDRPNMDERHVIQTVTVNTDTLDKYNL